MLLCSSAEKDNPDQLSEDGQKMNPDKYFNIDGAKMHFIDSGKGSPIVMLHGNPTWSFFYRTLVEDLSKTNRVIVPNHIGMGLSDKPQDAEYCLSFHIQNLQKLIEHLKLDDFTLIVHDWGGAIGFGYAVEHPQQVKKIVILNSSAFFDKRIPKRILMCRGAFSKILVLRLNAFARAATIMASAKRLPKNVRKEYLRPYNTYENRIGIYTFLRDIPVRSDHKTRQVIDDIEKKLQRISSNILILWGERDFCFTKHFYDRWKSIFPHAKAIIYPNAGHYILEDVPDEVLKEIKEFIA